MLYKKITETTSNTLLLILLLAATVSHEGKLFGFQFEHLITNHPSEPFKNIDPQAFHSKLSEFENSELVTVRDGVWNINSTNQSKIGTVLHTSVFSQGIYGFAGPVPLLIYLDNDSLITSIYIFGKQ